jgi:hypothetical protein
MPRKSFCSFQIQGTDRLCQRRSLCEAWCDGLTQQNFGTRFGMIVLELLLRIPAEVVAVKVLPLLPGRDVVRLDSANLSHRTRQALRDIFDICSPVSLQLDAKKSFQQEHKAWEWFWKRSMSFVPSPNMMSISELAKMIGHENFTHGQVHVHYSDNMDYTTIVSVLRNPKLLQKVSQLSAYFRSAQDPFLYHIHGFHNICSLSIETSIALRLPNEVVLQLLHGVASLNYIRIACVVSVTDPIREALVRHASTIEFASLTPCAATSLDLYSFYAQCKNLQTLHLHNAAGPGQFLLIPANSVTDIATGCPRLRNVYFGQVETGFDALAVFASQCPELQRLDGICILTALGLAALNSNCLSFTDLLNVSWAVLGESVVRTSRAVLSRLQRVSVRALERDPTGSFSNTLRHAVAYMKELQTFQLTTFAPEVAVQSLLALNSCKLCEVFIHCTYQLEDPAVRDAMATVAARSPALLKLHWSENEWLSDDVVYTIAASCPLLQELCAENEYPSALTDAAVVALAQGCPKLTMLEGLSGPALTDASVMALAENCPNLSVVYLVHSPQVTEAALTTLVQRCRELQRLYVCGSSINTAAVLRLRSVATDNGAGDEVVLAVGQEDDEDSDDWAVD